MIAEARRRTLRGLACAWLSLSASSCEPGAERAPQASPGERFGAFPASADQPIELRDDDLAIGVSISLVGARPVAVEELHDKALYPHALGPGSTLTLRTREGGFEDVVALEAPLPEDHVSYRLHLEGVAGLRLVERTLELLDATGAPRLRMAPPFALTREGAVVRLPVTLTGCAFDEDPAPPWGRAVTPPGSDRCVVRVELGALDPELDYPVLVDPIWSTTSSMIQARSTHAATQLTSGRVLVVGVNQPGDLDAELFDPNSGTFAAVGAMLDPRSLPELVALSAPSQALVVGGQGPCDGCPGLAATELFEEATGTFRAVGDLATARTGHAAAPLADGRVLVVGGKTGLPGAPHQSVSELYDRASESFAAGPSLAYARSDCTLTPLPDGTALVVGGTPGPKAVERFDPTSNSFLPAGELAERRAYHGAALLSDGRVLVAGGSAPGSLDPVLVTEIFDPSARVDSAWSLGGELRNPHYFGSIAALSQGRAVFAGGCCDTNSVELFEPTLGQWVTTNSLPEPRRAHEAVAISDTVVLVTGGYDDEEVTASAVVFSLSLDGDPCTSAGECGSGHCVDEVCCDSPCDAACLACSSAAKGEGQDGICAAVQVGQPDPRGACPGASGECGATGLCAAGATCGFVAEGAPCGGDDCPSRVGSCSGEGACQCEPPSCSADGVSVGQESCSPYRCREGACLTECHTSSECSSGFLCNDGGRCTTPPLPPSELSCACRSASPPDARGQWIWLGACAACWALRRRPR